MPETNGASQLEMPTVFEDNFRAEHTPKDGLAYYKERFARADAGETIWIKYNLEAEHIHRYFLFSSGRRVGFIDDEDGCQAYVFDPVDSVTLKEKPLHDGLIQLKEAVTLVESTIKTA